MGEIDWDGSPDLSQISGRVGTGHLDLIRSRPKFCRDFIPLEIFRLWLAQRHIDFFCKKSIAFTQLNVSIHVGFCTFLSMRFKKKKVSCTVQGLNSSDQGEWHSLAQRWRSRFPQLLGFDSRRPCIYFNVGENYRQRHFLERVDSARSLRVAQTHLVLVCWKSRTSKKLFRPFDGIFFSPLLQIFYVFCLKFE